MNVKVVHIVTQDCGGAGTAVLRLHHALIDNGVDSKVLTLHKSPTSDASIVQYETRLKPRYIAWIRSKLRSVRFRLRISNERWERLAHETTQQNPCYYTLPISTLHVEKHPLIQQADIIHLHWIENFINYPSFFSSIQKPLVWTFHDINCGMGGFHFQIEKDNLSDHYQKLEQYFLNIKYTAYAQCSDIACIALSTEMATYIQNIPPLEKKPVYKIPNIADTILFRPVNKSEAKTSLGLPQDKKILLFISDYPSHPSKGLHFLLNAVDQIQNSNIIICIVGGHVESSISERADVVHLGYISNNDRLCEVYSAADMMVMPSLQEAFSLTTLEATACGLPIVAFPCGGVKDMICNVNGVVCNDFSVDSLIDAITIALSREYKSDSIRAITAQNYSTIRIAQQYIDVYHSLLKLKST